MRLFSLIFLLVFVGVVAVFGWQNRQDVTLNFFQWSITADMAIILGAAFLLGMFSGWSILGILRRSVSRTAELFNRQPAPARA